VVAEVAIAVTLVVNAALMLRTFMNLQGVDVGFSTRSTLAVSLDLTTGPLRGRGTAAGFLNDALARITAIPGVTAAASTTQALFTGQVAGQAITREGRPPLTQADSPHVVQSAVTPAFFGLMGMQLRNGRLLSDSDSGSGKLVAVINKRAADLYWPGEDPVGRRFAIGSRERFGFFRPPPTPGAIEWREVVGVVSDVRSAGFQSDIQPEVYFSYQQFPIYDSLLLIRTSTSSTAVVPAIRQELLALNPRAVITKVRTLEEAADTSLSDQKLRAGLLSAFSLLAVGLGILGIYGVMSYSVAQRTREIGIRMALGAGRPDITAMVIGGALRLTFAGVAVGLAVSLLTAQWMSSLLFGVSATDAPTLAIAPVLFALAAAAASYLPARRAICVDPSTSLRSE
jgi:predicted permease